MFAWRLRFKEVSLFQLASNLPVIHAVKQNPF